MAGANILGLAVLVYGIFLALPSLSSDQIEYLKKIYQKPNQEFTPQDNAFTRARVELGKTLFFDPRLSLDRDISCASCHQPSKAWSDGLPVGIGHRGTKLRRRTPTIMNVAYLKELFWDGRSNSLEAQALAPIVAKEEMNLDLEELERRLQDIPGYTPLFEDAYPGEGITRHTVAKALANFERSVVSGSSDFDKWLAGDDHALTDEQKRGFLLFNSKARCATCHSGWMFSDGLLHDVGALSPGDLGKFEYTKNPSDKFAFKTPTLRDVEKRAPYLHNGDVKTLEDVVWFYNAGGRVRRPTRAQEISPLRLSRSEVASLMAFLKSLTETESTFIEPELP